MAAGVLESEPRAFEWLSWWESGPRNLWNLDSRLGLKSKSNCHYDQISKMTAFPGLPLRPFEAHLEAQSTYIWRWDSRKQNESGSEARSQQPWSPNPSPRELSSQISRSIDWRISC